MLLEVKNLSVKIKKSGKEIVKNISFNMEENTCLGILGESGSGKSMTCKSILGILKENLEANGEIIFGGRNLLTLKKEESRDIRGKEICMILQNPMTSFDPLYTIGNQLLETFLEHLNINRDEAYKLAVESLEKMRLKDIEEVLKKYSHELSGGQLQRVCIARAISTKPKFIMLDEAVSSLDISTQVEILNLLQELKKSYSLSYIFVTHDLLTLTYICDSVIFFKEGRIVEKVDSLEKLCEVKDDYSKALLDAVIEF
ncbi:ABC transporter ATP-binding protein [Fusobacterium polymorphum]|uniref:ABC transporter ATP-binding protein n=1 Tax=Fusobacterium nucleatum subsp. polymorphum TaxID=76857 RepID=UPI00300A6391